MTQENRVSIERKPGQMDWRGRPKIKKGNRAQASENKENANDETGAAA